MNRTGMELMKRCVEGDASESERHDFVRMLSEDDSLLEAYCEEIRICSALEWHYSIESDLKASVRRRSNLVTEMRRRQQEQARWIGLAAAAAIILLAALFGAYRIIDSKPSASFVANDLAQWEIRRSNGKVASKQKLAAGDRIDLKRGAVELSLQDGVRAILEAPATLTLVDRGEVLLGRGCLSTEVRDSAGHGFTVQTPRLRATDLGTRFTINVPAEGTEEEIHIAEGKVRVSAANQGTQILHARQAAVLMPDGSIARVPFDPFSFRPSLDQNFPPYIRWTFDAEESSGFPATGPLGGDRRFSAVLRSTHVLKPAPTLVEGLSGRALVLHGEGDFADTGWTGIPSDAPFSVAVWFRASLERQNHGNDSTRAFPSRNLLSWGAFHSESGSPGMAIDFPWIAKETIGWATVSGNPTRAHVSRADPFDGQWHHLVSVFHGPNSETEVSHFFDGQRLEATATRAPWVGNHSRPDTRPQAMPLRLGIAAINVPGLPTFAVTIDDVRVFDTPLHERAVINLFRER